MPALSVLGASWRLKSSERSLLMGTYMPWALHAGSRSADLMCLYYERHFEVCLMLLLASDRAKYHLIYLMSVHQRDTYCLKTCLAWCDFPPKTASRAPDGYCRLLLSSCLVMQEGLEDVRRRWRIQPAPLSDPSPQTLQLSSQSM